MNIHFNKEDENEKYLNSLLNTGGDHSQGNDNKKQTQTSGGTGNPPPKTIKTNTENSNLEYKNIHVEILPSGRYYQPGTKIMIRAARVSEIQLYSMVDDNNYVDITDKMNTLLSNNIKFVHPDGTEGSYKDVKDSDRVFIIFMIREMTFQGGNTLSKEVDCDSCGHNFTLPYRTTPSQLGPKTIMVHEPNEEIEDFFNKETRNYEIEEDGVSWSLAPPTIGIQEEFFNEIKRNVEINKKPDVAFMKIVPYLLHDKSSITPEEIKNKQKEFNKNNQNIEDLELFQALNEIINKMKVGIKDLKMVCPECGQEVHTDLTFPNGASKIFEKPNILERFRKIKR